MRLLPYSVRSVPSGLTLACYLQHRAARLGLRCNRRDPRPCAQGCIRSAKEFVRRCPARVERGRGRVSCRTEIG